MPNALAFFILRGKGIFHRVGGMNVIAHLIAIAVHRRPRDRVVIQSVHADRPVVIADHTDDVADDFGDVRVEWSPDDVVHEPRGVSETSWKRK